MKKTILVLLLTLIVLYYPGFGKEIQFQKARVYAQAWCEILRSEYGESVFVSCEKKLEDGAGYIFDLHPKGIIMVSPDDRLPPIKFYSLTGNSIILEEKGILKILEEENRESLAGIDDRSDTEPEKKFLERYIRRSSTTTVAGKNEVQPMLRCEWSQSGAYNLMMPVFDGYRAPAGCVAISLGQVMWYHKYPARGRGSMSYIYNGIKFSTDFSHEYKWHKIKEKYLHANDGDDESLGSISRLVYDVGISVIMVYGKSSSSANPENAIDAMPKHFKYSEEIEFLGRFGYNDKEWFTIAKEQIDQGLPVPYTISGGPGGHQVVIDGYRIIDDTRHLHINFGYGGAMSGYYAVSNVGGYIGDTQCFIINMKPPNYRLLPAPTNIRVIAMEERSWLIRQYELRITWETENQNGEYVVYRKPTNGEEYERERVSVIQPGQEMEYRIDTNNLDFLAYEYAVIAEDSEGNFSKNHEWYKVQKENF